MNLRHKYVLGTVRTLFGLMLIFSGVSGLMALKSGSLEGVPEAMIPTMTAFVDSGIFHMIKVTEVVAGLMLVLNFLPALAALFVAPIGVGVIVFNARMAPEYIMSGVIVCVLTAYLGYAYWDKYKALFARKSS